MDADASGGRQRVGDHSKRAAPAMTACASPSAPDVTAPTRLRTRAAARVAVLALLAALGQATVQPATAAVPTGEGPYTIFGDTAPIGAYCDNLAVELGVKFRTDVDGWITGVRFYKGPGNGGTHTGSLWTASGELLASGTFSAETDEGWQQLAFDEAVPVHSGRTYVASYFKPGGCYSTNPYYFTGSAAGEGPVHALASGVDGPNGVFQYGPQSSFPVVTHWDQNYWVDVVFLAAIPADEDPAEPTDPVDPTDPVPSPVPSDPAPSPVPSDPVPSPVPSDPVPSPVPFDPAPSPDPTVSSDPVPSPDEAAPADPVSSPAPTDPVSSPAPADPVSSPAPTGPTDPAHADPGRQAVVADPAPAMTAPAPGLDETGITADPDARAQLADDQDGTTAAVRVALVTALLLAAAAGFGAWHVRRVRGRRL
jgi:hypothetical protein